MVPPDTEEEQAEAEEELRRQHTMHAEVRCKVADSVHAMKPVCRHGCVLPLSKARERRGSRAILVPEEAMSEILTSRC